MKHELVEAMPVICLIIAFVFSYANLAFIAKRMRDELRRRDAEGCQHGTGPSGRRRDGAT